MKYTVRPCRANDGRWWVTFVRDGIEWCCGLWLLRSEAQIAASHYERHGLPDYLEPWQVSGAVQEELFEELAA